MTQIEISASRRYTVTIGCGSLNTLSQTLRRLTNAEKVCIVSDKNVFPLYGEQLCKAMTADGFSVAPFVFRPGEEQKNGFTYLNILECLAVNGFTGGDCIIALGGGVAGDLAGFAAATYLRRGIPFIQVPTSLLAMVDSSVGGKTGINLEAGKNLCGAFYQPSAVLCDPDVLKTLPEDVFRDGCAEIVKYAVLFDPELFGILEQDGLDFDREAVIARCVAHKRNCIQSDEFDRGERMLLNLGHTIGHAVEQCSHYEISHGKAVAIGMAMICRAKNCVDTDRILHLLEKFGLPRATDLPAEALWEAALSDKKRSGELVNLIVPKAIGDCRIAPTTVEELKTLLKEGM